MSPKAGGGYTVRVRLLFLGGASFFCKVTGGCDLAANVDPILLLLQNFFLTGPDLGLYGTYLGAILYAGSAVLVVIIDFQFYRGVRGYRVCVPGQGYRGGWGVT